MSRLGEYDLKRGSIALALATVMLLSVVGLGFVGPAAANSDDIMDGSLNANSAEQVSDADSHVAVFAVDWDSADTFDGSDTITIEVDDDDAVEYGGVGTSPGDDLVVEFIEDSSVSSFTEADGEINVATANDDGEFVIEGDGSTSVDLSDVNYIRVVIDSEDDIDQASADPTESVTLELDVDGENDDTTSTDLRLGADAPIDVSDADADAESWSSLSGAIDAAESDADITLNEDIDTLRTETAELASEGNPDKLDTITVGTEDLTIESADDETVTFVENNEDTIDEALDLSGESDIDIDVEEFVSDDRIDNDYLDTAITTGNSDANITAEFTDFADTTIDVAVAEDGLNISDSTFSSGSAYTAIDIDDTDSGADIDLGVEDAGNDISGVDSADAIVVSDMADSTLGINATEISDVDDETAIDINADNDDAEVTIDDATLTDSLTSDVTAVGISGDAGAEVTVNGSDLTGPGIGTSSVGIDVTDVEGVSITNNDDIADFEKQVDTDGDRDDITLEDNEFAQKVDVFDTDTQDTLADEAIFGSIDEAVSVGTDNFVVVEAGTYDQAVTFDQSGVTLDGPESETAGVDLDGDVTIDAEVDINGDDIEIAGVEIDANADEIVDVETNQAYDFTVHNTSIVGASGDTLIDADTQDGALTVESVELNSQGTGPGILIDDDGSDEFTIENTTFTGDGVDDGTGLDVDDTDTDDIEALTIEDNTFEANEKHVDASGISGTNLGDLLDTNAFVEAAIVYDEEGGSFDAADDAIHGSIDTAAAGAGSGDFINVSAATYTEDVTLDTNEITVYGPANETTHTEIDTEDNAVIAGKTTIDENIDVAGFVFEASDGDNEAVQTDGSAQGELTNSVVTNASDESTVTGIDFDEATGAFDVEDVHVGAFDGASGFSTGIEDSEGTTFEVTRSTISENEQGVFVDTGADTTVINNNSIVDNTEDAIELDDSNDLDARYNYLGEDDGIVGPNAVENNNVTETQGDLFYEPLLTVEHTEIEESDVSDTVDYAFDLTVEDGGQGEFAPVGFSGQSDQELGEAFSDFEGVIYEWDAEEERFDSLDSDDADREVDTLEAFIASPADGEDVIVNIEIEDDAATPSPASTNLEPGWNFVASGSERNADDTQSLSVQTSDTKEVFAYSDNPSSIAGGSGFTTDVQRDDGSSVSTSPFVGYFVFVEDDTPLSSQVSENTNAEDVQDDDNLALETP